MGGTLYTKQSEVIFRMKDISKSYGSKNNTVEALKEVNLEIRSGEFVGIMGPSAAGKSTLLNLIGCLDTPTSGDYILNGRNMRDLTSKDKAFIRNKVFGFIFQSFHLLPELDAASNIALPLKYSNIPKHDWRSMVIKALKTVGMEEASGRYPDQLSGGQQQKVAIARALVNNPEIILADEPTGNLDTASGESIMQELARVNRLTGKTIIFVTHNLRITGYAKRLIRLEDGRITEDISLLDTAEGNRLKDPFSEPLEEVCHETFL